MKSHRSAIPAVIFALVALIGLSPSVSGAQTDQKPHRGSFSNTKDTPTPAAKGSQLISDVVAEPNTADAIAADALSDIYVAADEHFHKGEWNHCINLNQIVIEGDPHNMDAYSDNAFLLWSSDRDALGIATLKKGIAANSDNYFMYDELGAYYWLHHKAYASAVPYYEQAVKFKCPPVTWHGLAHCYEKLGQWDKALKAWQTASNYPGDMAALVNLRRVKAVIARQQVGGH